MRGRTASTLSGADASALNMLRLEGFWNGRPLDRSRTSHLARLCVGLAA